MGSHTRYTNAKKMNILSVVEKLRQDENLNLAQATAPVQVDPSVIYRWLHDPLNPKKEASKMSLHPGPTSLVSNIEKGLLNFIEEWRQKGFEVNCFTLLRKARELKPEILHLSEGAMKICLLCFLVRNNLAHRAATHTAQHDPCEVEAEALLSSSTSAPLSKVPIIFPTTSSTWIRCQSFMQC